MFDETILDDLQRLRPSALKLDAVTVAYAAGRRSAKAAIWRWRTFSSIAVVVLVVSWSFDRRGNVAGRVSEPPPIAYAALPPINQISITPHFPADAMSVAVLQQRVLKFGLDGLPPFNSQAMDRSLRANDILTGGGL